MTLFKIFYPVFIFVLFSTCTKPGENTDPNSLFIKEVKLNTIDNKPLYLNYNINDTRIDGLVENDGIPGLKFLVTFIFPDGVVPISITPDGKQAIDFSSPVTFDVQYTKSIKKQYTFYLKEESPNPALFNLENIEVQSESGSASNIKLIQSGTDYIGLSQNQPLHQKYRLMFTYPPRITPTTINPDPKTPRDYSKGVTFDIVFDGNISKKYSVKIGNYNTADFKRTVTRGVWVSDVGSDVFASQANIKECIDICKNIGINTIFVVTYNNAQTKYPSEIMKEYMGVDIDPKYRGRDPLRELINLAKPAGIKVVAWFEYGFASVYGDNTGGSLIARYPSWASKDNTGKITEKNSFYWLDAFNPDVQKFIKRLMVEVVEKYPDIDGVQGDDRLPALPSNGGYNETVTALYKKETGKDAPANSRDAQWMQWRANRLSDFGEYIYRHVKAIDGKYMVSWSPSPYAWSFENYLQDSPEWLKRNIADYLHPQLYRTTFDSYKASFDQAWGYMGSTADRELIFSPGVLIGVGSGDSITPEILDRKLAYNRSRGVNGETFFYYERIRRNKGFQDVIKKHNL